MIALALLFEESANWRGQWWYPGTDQRHSGVLSYDPQGGLKLQIVGVFPPQLGEQVAPGAWAVMPGGAIQVLAGLVDGRPVTLLDCLSLRSRGPGAMFGGSVEGEQDLSVYVAMFGVEIQTGAERAFDRVALSLEGLTRWAGRTGVATHREVGGQDRIMVRRPEDQTAHVEDDHYRLTTWTYGPETAHRADGISTAVRQETHLIVEPANPMLWNELRDKAGAIVNLVSVARRSRSKFLSFRLRVASTESEDAHGNWVDVLWKQRSGPAYGDRVAFSAAEIGFEKILGTWLTQQKRLSNAVNLLQAVWDDGWYLESAVLALATAVESLGSTYDLPQKMPKQEYRIMVAEVVAAAPIEHQGWLRSALGGMNGPSLKAKCEVIARRLPSRVQEQLLPSVDVWARVLARARNDLSHSGNTNLDWEALAALRQVTSAVIYLAILVELGLSDEQVESVLTNDSYLQYACVRSARHFAS